MDLTTTLRVARLFVVSYAPLMAIVSLRSFPETWQSLSPVLAWAAATLFAAVGLVDAFRLPRGALKRAAIRIDLSNPEDHGGAVAAYMATYLLPFLGFEVADWRDAAGFLVYFVVLFLVFLRSDLALVNPTLYLMGWRVVTALRHRRSGVVERVLLLVPASWAMSDRSTVDVVEFGRFLIMKADRSSADELA